MKGGEGLWVMMEAESMWPGFCAGLVGAKVGEDRTVEVTAAEDFAVPALRGKKSSIRPSSKPLRRSNSRLDR